eukprot:12298159-Alexandrium_andersonii.AAC.1
MVIQATRATARRAPRGYKRWCASWPFACASERPECPESPERPECPESHERPECPERPERPERPEHPERPERPESPERPERPELPERAGVPDEVASLRLCIVPCGAPGIL